MNCVHFTGNKGSLLKFYLAPEHKELMFFAEKIE